MKTNLKSGNAIVRLLLAHGEKIGILAIGVCTAVVIWSAIGRERLAREPSDLSNLASQAQTKLTGFTWDGLSEEDKKIAEPVPEAMMAKISPRFFPNFPESFDPAVSDPISLRTDPVLLAPIDLEVNSDSGLWASASPEVIRRKTIERMKEQEEKERVRKAAQEKAQRDAGKRGARGAAGSYGGGEGAYGARAGAGAGRDGKTAKDAPIVRSPRTGAQLQGYEEITAKSWVTVLAKVPIDEQTQQYIDALRTSRGYDEQVDVPRYLGYQIERAEVTSRGQAEWEMIKFVKEKILLDEISTYPVNVADVIDPDVKHPLLTHPLPPLILREWGERVSHSSMPLAEEKARAEAEARQQPEEAEEPAESTGDEELFGEAEARTGRAGSRRGGYGPEGRAGAIGGRGAYGGRGRGGEYGGEYGGGYGGAYGGMGGEYGGMGGGYGGGGYGGEYGGGGYGGSLGRGSDVTLEEFVWDQETPHVLFRYFDNTVKPGHSYRYRIRLAMQDVNHKVKPKYLDKTVTERREETGNKFHRWAEWSEQSPVASVPLPARIYLVSAKPARESSYTAEPEVEILIKALNSEHAAEVALHESFSRGSVINISDKAKVVWANKFDDLESPSFKFLTGITVCDFTGGEKLGKSKEMLSPARALLMDAAGHLFVQEEMDDLETVDEYQAILEAGKDDRSRGRRGGFEGGYGGGYGGGEYGGEFGGEGF